MSKMKSLEFAIKRQAIHEERMKKLGFTQAQMNEAFNISNFILESFIANGITPNQVSIEAIRILLSDSEEYDKMLRPKN